MQAATFHRRYHMDVLQDAVEAITPVSSVEPEEIDDTIRSTEAMRHVHETYGHPFLTTRPCLSTPNESALLKDKAGGGKWNITTVRVGFDVTRKGERSLVIDGYKFTKSREGLGARVFWRCSRRECKATAVTVADRVDHIRSVHLHGPPSSSEFFSETNAQPVSQQVRFNTESIISTRSRIRQCSQPVPSVATSSSISADHERGAFGTTTTTISPHPSSSPLPVNMFEQISPVNATPPRTSMNNFNVGTLTAILSHFVESTATQFTDVTETDDVNKAVHPNGVLVNIVSAHSDYPSSPSDQKENKGSTAMEIKKQNESDHPSTTASSGSYYLVDRPNEPFVLVKPSSSLEQLAAIATSIAHETGCCSSIKPTTPCPSSNLYRVSDSERSWYAIPSGSCAKDIASTLVMTSLPLVFADTELVGEQCVNGHTVLPTCSVTSQSRSTEPSYSTIHAIVPPPPPREMPPLQANAPASAGPLVVSSIVPNQRYSFISLDYGRDNVIQRPIEVESISTAINATPITSAYLPVQLNNLYANQTPMILPTVMSVQEFGDPDHGHLETNSDSLLPPNLTPNGAIPTVSQSDFCHLSEVTYCSDATVPNMFMHWKKERMQDSIDQLVSAPSESHERLFVGASGQVTGDLNISPGSGKKRKWTDGLSDEEGNNKTACCCSASTGQQARFVQSSTDPIAGATIWSTRDVHRSSKSQLTSTITPEQNLCTTVQDDLLVKVLNTVQQLTAKLDGDADPPEVIQNCRAIQACLDTIAAIRRLQSVNQPYEWRTPSSPSVSPTSGRVDGDGRLESPINGHEHVAPSSGHRMALLPTYHH